jgi:hypothetical protein
LTEGQKKLYKQMLQQAKNVDVIKKNFNKDNIFEVENFNF